MDIQRDALEILSKWKKDETRKPMIIRGARQVGKTTLVRQFAKKFSSFIELNLEKAEERKLFEIESTNDLVSAIFLQKKVQAKDGQVLLFIDEIQEEPRAISQLRYLHEDHPHLFVIAAGSLLEFALNSISSFPVGRVTYLYLHPLSFREFLRAMGDEHAMALMETIPVPEYAHEILLQRFHQYTTVGGMPEIVKEMLKRDDYTVIPQIAKDLWQSYKDDVEKYGRNLTERKVIRHIIETAPHQSDRIKMEGFGQSNYKSREVGEALRALHLARIIRLVYPTTSLIPPVITEKRRRPRLQFLDTGLLNHSLNLTGQMIGLTDMSDLQRGKIVQHIVTQELISTYHREDFLPHFWVREERDNSAEVDLVYPYQSYLIPIEVKSGKQGKLRSLHQFVEKSKHPYAVRFYAGKFSIERHTTPGGTPYWLMNLPYYLAFKIKDYISFFIDKHSFDQLEEQ